MLWKNSICTHFEVLLNSVASGHLTEFVVVFAVAAVVVVAVVVVVAAAESV